MGMNWHSLDVKEIMKKLKTSKKGISDSEVNARLKKYGKNQLKEKAKLSALKIFFRQFNSFLIYILIIAAIVSLIIGIYFDPEHYLDFYVIMAIIVINGTLGFVQEYKAEKAILELKKMLVIKAKVIRNGKLVEIDAKNIVPGDILDLEEGNKVMADCRIIDEEGLQTSEAILTGESTPQDKSSKAIRLETELADRTSMLYAGTGIVRGNGKAVVTETGMNTEFGKIAELAQEVRQERTPMMKKLDTFAKKIGITILLVVAIIGLAGTLLKFNPFDMFLTSVGLAVAAIPEGLPVVITITLALSVRRMYKSKALIRKLPAAETLGKATIICTDKTGTLTQEKMTIREIYAGRKIFEIEKLNQNQVKRNENLHLLLKVGILCNNARLERNKEGKYIIGDPTEKALIEIADSLGLSKKELTEKEPRLREFSFSSDRKMMSIIRQEKSKKISYVKGSPEAVVKNSTQEYVNGKIVKIDDKRRKEILKEYNKMASSALRVLGFGFKEIRKSKEKIRQKEAESDLIFVGLQGMIDMPRKEVKIAIRECKEAGIKIKMITGDSALTANAIGKMIGLSGEVVTGAELEKMSESKFEKAVEENVIFARVTPQHKLKIIELLKSKGEIVAVTGDGVNDSPALKKADIGVAMGIRGSDVSREVSDMVLLDDNFATIVNAIKEGRRAEDNTKKFIKFLLAANADEVMIILVTIIVAATGIIAGLPLPLLPLQILWLNLVTDSFPALALGKEKAEVGIMKRKPRSMKEGILHGVVGFIILAGFIALISTFSIFLLYNPTNLAMLERARTVTLSTLIIWELFFVFTCRSDRNIWKIGWFTNKFLLWAIMGALVLHLIAIYTPLNVAFDLVPLGWKDWVIVAALSTTGLIFFEIKKLVVGLRKRGRNVRKHS